MKKRLIYGAACAMMMAGCTEYSLDTDFTVPDTLSCPESVTLDVTSSGTVPFSWTGGGAADGGIVLYQVYFDREDGDFSDPIETLKSDFGAEPSLTMTHAALNAIARKAGIYPEQTGRLKWTVSASKGGEVRMCGVQKTITVTRGEGIDNIPSELYLYGTAAENAGQQFRLAEDGVFVIYTEIGDGSLTFKSSSGADAYGYFAEDGKLKEGDGTMQVSASGKVVRITVDYNTLSVAADYVGKSVRCIWGATFDNIAVLEYSGQGRFTGEGDIVFIDQSRPETNPPSWLSWTEERYYFIAELNGGDICWGRGDEVSAERPVGGEDASFYALHEFTWSQWDHLWKMSGSLDNTHAVITIDTNADGLMIHTFTNVTAL